MPREVQRLTTAVDADAAFLDWLAGFADGEGCFYVTHKPTHGTGEVMCGFAINLRADDEAILRECIARCGTGHITYTARRGNAGAQCRWTVESVRGTLRLVDIFDAHPLRAKKRHDYAIWRQAVVIANAREDDWKAGVLALRNELMNVRRYVPEAV